MKFHAQLSMKMYYNHGTVTGKESSKNLDILNIYEDNQMVLELTLYICSENS